MRPRCRCGMEILVIVNFAVIAIGFLCSLIVHKIHCYIQFDPPVNCSKLGTEEYVPSISQTGLAYPERAIFVITMVLATCLAIMIFYLRYKQVGLLTPNCKIIQRVNTASLFFYCMIILGCLLVLSIPIKYTGHTIGAALTFLGGCIYMIIQTYLTYKQLKVRRWPYEALQKTVLKWRLVILILCLACIILEILLVVIRRITFGKEWWAICFSLQTSIEWIAIALLYSYVTTFYGDFKSLKWTVRVPELEDYYDEYTPLVN